MAINSDVIKLINRTLTPLIDSGCHIDKIKMVVAEGTELVQQGTVQTWYGTLRVEPGDRVPQGRAYLIEDRYQGSAWVK
ncbi:hypothetical protein [Paenibacillus sp. FSL R5-0519]|uniref:hypothetical protein n=1 Tax=Paenibacillus sp. FSL R5-0519 TaxID=2921648 RepID=UPI0030DC05B3